MAAIIDGSSVRGHWKITPDNGTPNAYGLDSFPHPPKRQP